MPLTWYFAHLVLGLSTVVALGRVSTEPLPVAAGCELLFFAVALAVSWAWKKAFRHGPLEALMRAVAG